MTDQSKEQKKKQKLLDALKTGKVVDDKSLALYQILEDAQDAVDKIEEIRTQLEEKLTQTKEDLAKEIIPSEEDLQNLIKPLIPDAIVPKDGEDGYTPVKGKDYFDGEDGNDGKDAFVDVPAIVSQASAMTEDRLKPFIPTIEQIEEDIPKLGEKIRDSLELLQGDERLDVTAIKGLKENLESIATLAGKQQFLPGGIVGRDIVKDIDISAQFNGVLTTFNIQAVWNIVNVSLSSYPYGSLRKNIDYSYTPTSITFLGTIDPTTQLTAGQQCVLTVILS